MAYDLALAERIRRAVADRAGVTEKQMFGGLAFLLAGKTFCGIVKSDLMVRVGPDRYEESLRRRHVRPMDFTGRSLTGYVFVGHEGCRTERMVATWVERGAAFVATLGAARRRAGRSAAARGGSRGAKTKSSKKTAARRSRSVPARRDDLQVLLETYRRAGPHPL
jgi:hypothetical protein